MREGENLNSVCMSEEIRTRGEQSAPAIMEASVSLSTAGQSCAFLASLHFQRCFSIDRLRWVSVHSVCEPAALKCLVALSTCPNLNHAIGPLSKFGCCSPPPSMLGGWVDRFAFGLCSA